MGVKGLATAVKKVAKEPPEQLPAGSTLVIDGDGWAFDVINCSNDSETGLLFGGDYVNLDSAVRLEVARLQAAGLKLVFYFGHGSDAFKDRTIMKRTQDREEMWTAAYTTCRERRVRKSDSLPIATLALDQVTATLLSLGVDIVDCEEESDQVISTQVCTSNIEGVEPHYCYGRDSDFFAMKQCPYIEFGSLEIVEGGVAAPVYRRDQTAAAFGLSEELFVELCILCGNDFTSAHERSDYKDAPSSDIAGISAVVEWLGAQEAFYRAQAVEEGENEIALQYTRAFYELEDISVYQRELEAYRQTIGYTKPSARMSMSLSREEADRLKVWTEMHDPRSPGRAILQYLSEKVTEPNGASVLLNGCAVVLSPDHIEAIDRTLAVVSQPALDYSSLPLRVDRLKKRGCDIPQWQDVLAGHAYQLLVSALMDENTLKEPSCQPLRNFDGALFHAHLEEIKQESREAALDDLADSLKDMGLTEGSADDADAEPPTPVNQALPIDAYREEILHRIARDRVTVIHGETGCGKSSRVPAMLLEHARDTGCKCKMMVSQPRRIAASSLMKRLRETLGDEVGLRMGHGVKDESSDTKLFFVTTGYLVRLLAYRPDHFKSHTHLIIDEVHERSVDGDVLCYLARRLLNSHPTLKLVLMSATMHISLYQDYFASVPSDPIYYGDLQCLSVGARRFPIDIWYTDTMCENGNIPKIMRSMCTGVSKLSDSVKSDSFPDPNLGKKQHGLAYNIVREVVEPGTGVLIFVSGIFDITEISELFAEDEKYVVVPIHSDIPFEDQELAFKPVEPDKIKVVVATNAAESSITLPDVDVVICLGTHKAIRYDAKTSHVQLANQFISKASAAQRAGRTGRTRPGSVYRLYSSKLFESMNDHDAPEVKRKPLEDVVLNLRAMLEESPDFTGVVPILESLLEAPATENISASFDKLYEHSMITQPGDAGELTAVGRMAGNLPVDLHLSKMIAYGIALGVGAEAVALAAALSLPKLPFRGAHILIHKDPDEYNSIIQGSFLAAVRADAGMYSTPLMLVNLLIEWRQIQKQTPHRVYKWLQENNVVRMRIQQFDSMAKNIARTVAGVLSRIDIRLDARRMPKYDLTSWFANQTDLDSDKGDMDDVDVDLDEIGSTDSSLPLIENSDDIAFDLEFLRDTINESNSGVVSELSELKPLKIGMSSALEQDKETTATRLNFCRLVLAWCSDGLVVNMGKLKKKMQADVAHTLRLGGQQLTKPQLNSIFPSGVPYEQRTTGLHVYDGHITASELSDLLARLCDMGQMMADGRYDSYSTSDQPWRHNAAIDVPAPVIWLTSTVPAKKSTTTTNVFFALPYQKDVDVICPMFPKNSWEDTEITMGIYRIFGVQNISKKQSKTLNICRSQLGRVISLAIPLEGHAKLTTLGCDPCYQDLDALFTVPATTTPATATAELKHGKQLPLGVSLQVMDQNCSLYFESERAIPDSPYYFESSIITDLPIGMRLYNAIKNSRYKDKCILVNKVPKEPCESKQGSTPSKTAEASPMKPAGAVPGSAEWLKARKKAEAAEEKDAPVEDDFISIAAASPNIMWSSKKFVNSAGLIVKNLFMPRESPIAAAIHLGDEPVFGSAFSVMDIFPGNSQRCDGVSLFPVGYKWIMMAFECAGLDTYPVYDSVKGKVPREDRLSSRDKKLIRLVHELIIKQVQDMPIRFNQDLTAAVQLLFSPWTSPGDYEVEDEEEEDIEEAVPVKKGKKDKKGKSSNATAAPTPTADFEVGTDYMSKLYKHVSARYGATSAESLQYESSHGPDGFVSTVAFELDGKVVNCSSPATPKKKVGKQMAAQICLSNLREKFRSAVEATDATDSATPMAPAILYGEVEFDCKADYKGTLKQIVVDYYGKAAGKTIRYDIAAKNLLVDGVLSFSIDGDKTSLRYSIKGCKSKKDAKRKLSFDAICNLRNTMKKSSANSAANSTGDFETPAKKALRRRRQEVPGELTASAPFFSPVVVPSAVSGK